jgi:hypothetical protein
MTRARAPRGHVQIPRSLIYSPDHSGLAVWTWAMYETLMPHGLDGGRAPAIARRRFLAERAGSVLHRPHETSERYAPSPPRPSTWSGPDAAASPTPSRPKPGASIQPR